jgi:hypothetical protein
MGKLGEHGVPLVRKSLIKQKVTTVSSTSAELIGVSDILIFFNALMSWRNSFKLDRRLHSPCFKTTQVPSPLHIWVAPRLMQSADSSISATSGLKNT